MATIAKLNVALWANTSQFNSGLRSAAGAVGTFQSQITAASSRMGTWIPMLAAGAAGLLGIGAAAQALKSGFELSNTFEKSQISFETMLGSGEKAAKLLQDIQAFAAATPFESMELIDATRKLIAFNIPLEQALPMLKSLGDLAAGIDAPIGELAEIFGKNANQKSIMSVDVNQLTGRGIPVIRELAKVLGISKAEVREWVEAGKVEFGHLAQALINLTGKGGQFHGLMDALSKSTPGLWSTTKDAISLALKGIADEIKTSLDIKGLIGQANVLIPQLSGIFVEGFRSIAASASERLKLNFDMEGTAADLNAALPAVANMFVETFGAITNAGIDCAGAIKGIFGFMLDAFDMVAAGWNKLQAFNLTTIADWVGAYGKYATAIEALLNKLTGSDKTTQKDFFANFDASMRQSAKESADRFNEAWTGQSSRDRLDKFFSSINRSAAAAVAPLAIPDLDVKAFQTQNAATKAEAPKPIKFAEAIRRGSHEALIAEAKTSLQSGRPQQKTLESIDKQARLSLAELRQMTRYMANVANKREVTTALDL